MGKDKKDKKGDGSSKTKETLIYEDIALTKELEDTEKQYKDIYMNVQELSDTYAQCKNHFPLFRYGDLKSMIKDCLTADALTSVRLSKKEGEKRIGLLQAARQYAEGAAAFADLSYLHKAEIIQDIEEKKKKKDKLEQKFLRLHNRLDKLKRDYDESKRYIPTRRYVLMKEMIKLVIRDDVLKPEP